MTHGRMAGKRNRKSNAIFFFSLVFEEFVRKHHFLQASPLSTPGCHLTAGELITLPGGECQRRQPVPSLATQAG